MTQVRRRSQPNEHFISRIQDHHTAALAMYNDYKINKMCVVCQQIRQEKPYYIADPEVDSLVSTYTILLYIINISVVIKL